MLKSLTQAALFFGLTSAVVAQAETAISVEDAWIRSAPPTVKVMAGYMRISNHSNQTVSLTKVSSPQFESVEVHRTVMHEGMMHMEKIEPFVLEGHQEFVFEPGGYHLMLMDPHQPLAEGKQATLMMDFSNGDHVMIEAMVKSGEADDEMQNGGGHHHH